jgi:hypothetical protein
VAPIGPEWPRIEPAILLEAAHEVPSIVTNPLQQSSGGIPRVKYDIVRVTTQAIAGIAEQLQRQVILGGAPLPPQAYAQRNPQDAIRPDQQDEGEAIHRLALLTGIDPGEALNSRGEWLGDHRVIENEIPSLPDE